jgi:CheY-like chemotaxis protein
MEKILRILILEDMSSDADLMEYELTDAGFSFTSKRVWTEKEYLRGLDEFIPDLILSDYDLPQYTGALALAEAKRRHPEVPFILVTGALGKIEEKLCEIMAHGAHSYILKSNLDRLAPAVKKAFGINGQSQ